MEMNFLLRAFAYLVSIPARLKGAKIGKNSFIGPGYDFLFVRWKGVEIGNNVIIGKNAWIQTLVDHGGNPKVLIGDNTGIGRNVTISSIKTIKIGNNCLMGYNVSIFAQDHFLDNINLPPTKSGFTKGGDVIIEDECFIGAHSFILKGVHLGKHCVVGANSVVTKSFPAYSLIAGSPAKLVRRIK